MTFEQILEMDDDEEERDFSKSIVFGFFEQAENTFKNMDASLCVITPWFTAVLVMQLWLIPTLQGQQGSRPTQLSWTLPQRLFGHSGSYQGEGFLREDTALWCQQRRDGHH